MLLLSWHPFSMFYSIQFRDFLFCGRFIEDLFRGMPDLSFTPNQREKIWLYSLKVRRKSVKAPNSTYSLTTDLPLPKTRSAINVRRSLFYADVESTAKTFLLLFVCFFISCGHYIDRRGTSFPFETV